LKPKRNKWKAYTDLAWTESIVCSPEDEIEETELYSKAIKKNAKIEAKTLLHLACGAGINDYTFKKYFKVTGIDISENMLSLAKDLNPEIEYIHGDMRTIELEKKFDAVAIPDSIDYMKTKKDLKKVIRTANRHLNPGGVLLIVAHPKESFKENNFVYTGKKGNIEVTIFENNYIRKNNDCIYEATIIYLIRNKEELETYIDIHTLGLFDKKTWHSILKAKGFKIKETKKEYFYDDYILEDGEYPLHIFICIKQLDI
jgi:ubiquinone/menaquinone biosynthesis C-methylase UbiE